MEAIKGSQHAHVIARWKAPMGSKHSRRNRAPTTKMHEGKQRGTAAPVVRDEVVATTMEVRGAPEQTTSFLELQPGCGGPPSEEGASSTLGRVGLGPTKAKKQLLEIHLRGAAHESGEFRT